MNPAPSSSATSPTPTRESLAAISCSVSLPVPFYRDEYVTIYHGDCREIVPLLPSFDLLMTDPPYGLNMANKGWWNGGDKRGVGKARPRKYADCEWDAETVDVATMDMVRGKAAKQVIWGGNYYQLPPCIGPLVWDKENTGNFADGEMAWNNLGIALRIKRHLWNGMLRKGGEDRHHPTQKPLEVIQWAIQLAGDVETILDPWAGSGTTGHAAKNLGKRAVLIEREERYCEIAVARLAQDVLPFSSQNVY